MASSRQPAYTAVHVLMLCWKDSTEPEFKKQLNHLQKEFRAYNFDVETYEIDSTKSYTSLDRRLSEFLLHDDERTLLIVYYGGHGHTNKDKDCIWCRDTPDQYSKLQGPRVDWSSLQKKFLEDCSSHVLFVLDCCYADSCVRYTDAPGTVEALFATSRLAPLSGKHSFTMTLAATLRECRGDGKSVTVARLSAKIRTILQGSNIRDIQNTLPSHCVFSNQGSTIIIEVLEKRDVPSNAAASNTVATTLELPSSIVTGVESEKAKESSLQSLDNLVASKSDAALTSLRLQAKTDHSKELLIRSSANDKSILDIRIYKILRVPIPIPTVSDLKFSPDGRLLASTHNKDTILWSAETGEICHNLFSHDGVPIFEFNSYMNWQYSSGICRRVAFVPDSNCLAVAYYYGPVYFRDLAMKVKPTRYFGRTPIRFKDYVIVDLAFSPNGKFIATACFDGSFGLWSAEGSLVYMRHGALGKCLRVIFLSSGDSVLYFYPNFTLLLWRLAKEKGYTLRLLEDDATDSNASVALSGDENLVAISNHAYEINLWDFSAGGTLRKLKGHKDRRAIISSLAFSANNQVLASASHDCTVRLWNCATGELLQTLAMHTRPVLSVTFSPDGRRLASSSRDEKIILWDLPGEMFANKTNSQNRFNLEALITLVGIKMDIDPNGE